jgi:hypothetical protein
MVSSAAHRRISSHSSNGEAWPTKTPSNLIRRANKHNLSDDYGVFSDVVRCLGTNRRGPMGWLSRPIRVRFRDKIKFLLRGQVTLSI